MIKYTNWQGEGVAYEIKLSPWGNWLYTIMWADIKGLVKKVNTGLQNRWKSAAPPPEDGDERPKKFSKKEFKKKEAELTAAHESELAQLKAELREELDAAVSSPTESHPPRVPPAAPLLTIIPPRLQVDPLLAANVKGVTKLASFLAAFSKAELIKGAEKLRIDTTANNTMPLLKMAIKSCIYPDPAAPPSPPGATAAAAPSSAAASSSSGRRMSPRRAA